MPPLNINEMDHIVLNVNDIEKTLDFYVRVLGLASERVDEYRAGKVGFPSVRVNGETIIDLFQRKEGQPAEGPGLNLNHYCLVADIPDFDALVAYLKQNGVPIRGEPASRWGARGRGTSVYVQDPDGTELELRTYA